MLLDIKVYVYYLIFISNFKLFLWFFMIESFYKDSFFKNRCFIYFLTHNTSKKSYVGQWVLQKQSKIWNINSVQNFTIINEELTYLTIINWSLQKKEIFQNIMVFLSAILVPWCKYQKGHINGHIFVINGFKFIENAFDRINRFVKFKLSKITNGEH